MGIMNLAEVMDKSIEALKKHIKTIVLFCLVYGLIITISIFVFVLIGAIFFTLASVGSLNVAIWIILYVAAVLISAIVMSYSAGIIRIGSQDVLNERISFEDGIKLSFKSIPKLLGVAAISIIGFLPVVGIFVAIVYVMFGGFSSIAILLEYDTMYVIFAVVILIAFLMVCYSYQTILAFSIHGVIIEKKGPFASVKHSFLLVKHNFWRMFGSLLLISITVFALRNTIESFFFVVMSLLYLLFKILNFTPNFIVFISMFSSLLSWPLNIFTTMVIAPIGTIMTTFLYFNQRYKKEGYDLTLRLNEIERKERNRVSDAFRYNNSNPTGI